MGVVSICCSMHCHIADMSSNNCDSLYSGFKKLIAFLFKHQQVHFSFYFPGPFLEWLDKKHPESIIILRDMINRKQIELLGGGYYEPIFPLILPVDRIGQIEMNTTSFRKQFGKKLRGIFLGDSIWDPVLISGFKSCGIEYIIVNNSLVSENEAHGKVFIVEDMGKTINVIPYQEFDVNFITQDVNLFLDKITQYSDTQHTKAFQNDNRIYFTSFSINDAEKLIDSNWLESFCNAVFSSKLFDFDLPSNYIRNNTDYIKTFIAAGCPPNIQKWAISPFKEINPCQTHYKNANIRNFLTTYQEVQYLYSRMMYASLIATQCKGDKVRKNLARQNLWKAQTQDSYWFLGDAGVCKSENRKLAYKNLLLAEKNVREVTKAINDSFLSFDYDMDGRKEYVMHKQNYNAFISLCGGMVFELDIIATATNYCDTMRRTANFDGVTDLYPKKLFIDHLIDFDHYEKFKYDTSYCYAVFSQIVYQEISFDRVRKELVISANALFGVLQQPVSLKKKFTFSDNGIKLQYILKNDGPLPLKCYFAVESNLCFSGTGENQQLIEIISNENKEIINAENVFVREDSTNLIQFTDMTNKNQFIFESNEDAGVIIQPLYITRPIDGVTEKRYQATTSCFFWKIDIPAGYEFEKTIFLSIVPEKKSVKHKKQ